MMQNSPIESLKETLRNSLESENNDIVGLMSNIEKNIKMVLQELEELNKSNTSLAYPQIEEIGKIIFEDILPILFSYGFDKVANSIANAHFTISKPDQVEKIRNDIQQIFGVNNINCLTNEAMSQLENSIQTRKFGYDNLSCRSKSFYSIFEKLKKKGYGLNDLSDLIGIRLYPKIPDTTPLEAMHLILTALPGNWQILEFQRTAYVVDSGKYQDLNLQLLVTCLLPKKEAKVQLQIRYHNNFTLDAVYNTVYKQQLIPGLPPELGEISDLNWRRGEYYFQLEKQNLQEAHRRLITEIRARWKKIKNIKLLPSEVTVLEEIEKIKRSDYRQLCDEPNTRKVVLSFNPMNNSKEIRIPINQILSVEDPVKHKIEKNKKLFIYKRGIIETVFTIKNVQNIDNAKFAILCQTNEGNRFVYLSDRNPKFLEHTDTDAQCI